MSAPHLLVDVLWDFRDHAYDGDLKGASDWDAALDREAGWMGIESAELRLLLAERIGINAGDVTGAGLAGRDPLELEGLFQSAAEREELP